RPGRRGSPNEWLFSIVRRVGRTCPNSRPGSPRLRVASIMLPPTTGLPGVRASCRSV
ncbi:hypothetical protein HETIRDRAFT_224622, partial [Heterobasidion irregulare TC 32-1]